MPSSFALIEFLGGGGTVIFISLIVKFLFPSLPSKILEGLWYIVGLIFKRGRYQYRRRKIENMANDFVVGGLSSKVSFPLLKLKINFISGNSKEDVVYQENENIVLMHDRGHDNKNCIHAIYLFLSDVLFFKLDNNISKTQKNSLCLFVSYTVLKKTKNYADQFIRDYVNKELDEKIREYFKKYESIENYGIFFPILIQELYYLGGKIKLGSNRENIFQEIDELIDYLHLFSQRKRGERNENDFDGKYLKCAIRIFASSESIQEKGVNNMIDAYHQEVLYCINSQYEDIYILGRAEGDNIGIINMVLDRCNLSDRGVSIEKQQTLQGSKIKNILGKEVIVDSYFVHLRNDLFIEHIIKDE